MNATNPIFFLIRHGRTAGNEQNIYRSHSNEDFAQLNAAGRDDAREAGLVIAKLGIRFPLILSDDLDRTTETADILADILGIKQHLTDKRLRPVDMGEWTGKSKDKHPVEPFLKDRNKKIPGGESFNQFDKRQSRVFADISETVATIHAPVLVAGHGSNASFLYHNVNKGGKEVGYEGLTNPGGIMVFTKDGISPIFKKREGSPQLYKQGTEATGFVTDEENRPPRECWNCRNFVQVASLSACTHPLIMIDSKLQDRKQADGTIAVGERDCCDHFRNKIST